LPVAPAPWPFPVALLDTAVVVALPVPPVAPELRPEEPEALLVVVFVCPLWGCSVARIWIACVMKSCQMIAGYVPPSTGPPL
jgi:hypothetical protein